MALIHMEPEKVPVTERSQQAESSDPQHYLLTQAIMIVASVEHIGEGPVPRLVLAHIRVEQIHRDDMSGLTDDAIAPGPDMDRATFDVDRNPLIDQFRKVVDRPGDGFLGLMTLHVQALKKISSPVQQRHRRHRHIEIRSRANRVAGEHTEPSRIGRHPGLQADLHGEVCDERWLHHRWSPQ